MTEIKQVTLFTTDVYELEVNNVDQHLDYFKPYIDQLEQHKNVRTDYFNNPGYRLPDDLYETIIHAAFQVCGSKRLRIAAHWLQDYNTNHEHGLHTHGDSLISGAYYLRYQGHGGNIVFQNPNTVQWATNTGAYEHSIQPKKGKMLLFPGWQPHRVEPVKDTVVERTVLSFNIIRDE